MNVFIRSPGRRVGQAPRSWLVCREQHALCRVSSLGGSLETGSSKNLTFFDSTYCSSIAGLDSTVFSAAFASPAMASTVYLAEAVKYHSNCAV